MKKIKIAVVVIVAGLFVVIFIGGMFKNNAGKPSSLANISCSIVSEEKNEPVANKALDRNEIDSELERDKEKALGVANAFLDSLKSDPAEKIIQKYITEKRTISPERIQSVKEIFKEYPERSFKEYVFYGSSLILAKLCEGNICQGFYLTISQENDGTWKAYEVKKKTAEEMKNIERENEVLSKKPSEAVENFFNLLRSEKFSEAENLFHSRTDQWQRKGYIQKITESQENISLGTMEILGESDTKSIRCKFLFLDKEGFYTEYFVDASREGNSWKIAGMGKMIDNSSETVF